MHIDLVTLSATNASDADNHELESSQLKTLCSEKVEEARRSHEESRMAIHEVETLETMVDKAKTEEGEARKQFEINSHKKDEEFLQLMANTEH